MGAKLFEQTDPTGAVAKCDELLAEKTHPDRGAVGFQFRRQQRRHPISSQQRPHRGPGCNLR